MNARGPLDDHRRAGQGPQSSCETVGLRALPPSLVHLLELRFVQLRSTASSPCSTNPMRIVLPPSLEPSAYALTADVEFTFLCVDDMMQRRSADLLKAKTASNVLAQTGGTAVTVVRDAVLSIRTMSGPTILSPIKLRVVACCASWPSSMALKWRVDGSQRGCRCAQECNSATRRAKLLRSDNGVIAPRCRSGPDRVECIAPGSRRENAYVEIYDDKLRAEFLNLAETKLLMDRERL